MAGRASIGHTRYATSGAEDVRYAQPFERHHGRRWKWFSFGFNGQLANYVSLRDELRDKRGYHFSLDTLPKLSCTLWPTVCARSTGLLSRR
jgi:amidophosphoribosyltransferase